MEHRRRLINSFVNAIYLFDDHLVFIGNYKDGSKTVTFAELEAAGLGSDLTACAVPSLNSLNLFTVGKMFGLFCFMSEYENFTM